MDKSIYASPIWQLHHKSTYASLCARIGPTSDSTTTSTDYESDVELSDYDEAVLAKSKQRVKARVK